MDPNPSDNGSSSEQIEPQLSGESLGKGHDFGEACRSEAADVLYHGFIGSKVYHYPKLWHLRVSVIEGENIMPAHRGPDIVRFPEFVTKLQVGNFDLSTAIAAPSTTRSFSNPSWNKDLSFLIDEPFVDSLQVSVEDRMGGSNKIVVAKAELLISTIEKQVNQRHVTSSWFDLKSHFEQVGDKEEASTMFVPRICLQFLLHEVTMDNNKDVIVQGPADTKLWKPQIGVLEVQILSGSGFMPMQIKDAGHATSAYCVAKYGQKWFRTCTVVDSLSPEWNEKYNWEVYDLCTVVTVGVFYKHWIIKNNIYIGDSDHCIGKVRIRLSTLETNRDYIQSYPMLMLCPSGVKKMGELLLSMRISCSSVNNMLLVYTMPVLPKMHYYAAEPMNQDQLDSLTYQARRLLGLKMSREEPPLDYNVMVSMFDYHRWSMRRSKANFFRLMGTISGLIAICKFLKKIRDWQQPAQSILFLAILLTLMMVIPNVIIYPAILFCMVLMGLWNYRYRPRHIPSMDIQLSFADSAHPDELDEEFDTFPTTCSDSIVRMRYDRLRSIAGRLQSVVGDLGYMIEKFQALLSWRDKRASFLFLAFCLVAALVSYLVPIRVVISVLGLYLLRPPLFRNKLPPAALNFFRRIPSEQDTLF
ncbi:hypothetical protein PIB30_070318 [Stylosanthes scabra]|uniref:C2 domain-containing protein n=1 Tax=Stylosanthes scabra TaxID=79078 RepID=A0ABU6XLR8_9FABA|nr:hypothetical protein [Stylosanthes scabra]